MVRFGVLAFLALIVMPAQAAGRLEAKLVGPNAKTSDSIVIVDLRNTGDSDLGLVSTSIPWVNASGRLTNNFFRITDADGKEATYRGIFVSYDHAAGDEYETLAKGRSKTVPVDLSVNYDLVPGKNYQVSLRAHVYYINRTASQLGSVGDDMLRSLQLEKELTPIEFTAPAKVSPFQAGAAEENRGQGGFLYDSTPAPAFVTTARVSATGGRPNRRPYSRVNCGTLW